MRDPGGRRGAFGTFPRARAAGGRAYGRAGANDGALRAVIVTNIPTPYRMPVYELLDGRPDVDLRVVYLAERERNRQWQLPPTSVRSITLPSRVLTWRGRYIHFTTGVWRALRGASPDVVVTTGFNPPQLAAFAWAVLHGVPHVVQTDGTIRSEERLTGLHRALRRLEARLSRAFVAASDEGIELVASWGADRSAVFKSPLAIDNARFAAHVDDPKDVDLLFSGQLAAIKDPLFALRAAEAAARRLGRRLTVAFVGDGPLRDEVVAAGRAAGDVLDVRVAGFQQQSDLPAWYGRSRVFLFPTHWEPWGLVLNEASAAAVPAVVSPDAGSGRELITDSVDGFVRPLDVDDWAACAAGLLADGPAARAVGAAASARIADYDFTAAAGGLAAAVGHAARVRRRSRPSLGGARARVLIDVLGAPGRSGGMRLHAASVVTAWAQEHDDDLVVVGPSWIRELDLPAGVRRVVWPNDSGVLRAIGQHLVVPAVFRALRRQRLLATNSVISLLVPAERSTVVAHDWRHLSRPGEFTAVQRFYRRSWARSAQRAHTVVAVSGKTADETRRLVGRADVLVVENGRDHPASWPSAGEDERPGWLPPGRYLLGYGHHTNKRPALLLQAVAATRELDALAVVVLGVGDSTRGGLEEVLHGATLDGRVVLPGFVSEADYRWLVTRAAAVVITSSEEGFALPLAEAAYLGVPAVVTADSGVADLFADTAVPAAPDPASVGRAIVAALARGAVPFSTGNTWSAVASRLRRIALAESAG